MVKVDNNGLGGVATESGVGLLGSESSKDSAIVLKSTADRTRELSQLGGRGKDVARRANRGGAEEGWNGPVGTIRGESHAGICATLIIRESKTDGCGCAGLERDCNGSGDEQEGGGNCGLHFDEIE